MPERAVKLVIRAVIRQAIRDLSSDDLETFESAIQYIESPAFKDHIEWADYPPELLDIMRDVLQRSEAQRRVMTRQVLSTLSGD